MRRFLLPLLLLVAACDVNPFDAAQVPVVTATGEDPPTVRWTPRGAQVVRFFRGATPGDGYTPDFLWEVSARDGRNGLRSPVTYGVEPAEGEASAQAPALIPGETYSVWVLRYDEAGSGDGFTNTRNRYEGSAAFVYPERP